MTQPDGNLRRDTWDALEPYAQVMRALHPRIVSVTVFDRAGKLRWSTEATTGPDLIHVIDDVRSRVLANGTGNGELRLLDGSVPLYVFWLRDDAGELLATVALLCRPADRSGEGTPRPFALIHALLRPALECLRRDLLAHTSIAALRETVSDL